MDLNQSLIDEIIKRIRTVTQPEKIILFGSAATGSMTRDSDIDLLILKAVPGDRRRESVRLRESLGNLGFPVDIILMAMEHFEESKDVIGGLAYPAHKYGKVIYEAA
jgi:predicted nucleotidyltransferase